MARRRPAFKRTASKQYGWASFADRGFAEFGTVESVILVAGDADIEVRSIGGTHGNLKRIIADLVFHPWSLDSTSVPQSPTTGIVDLFWAILVVDNDDDATNYIPDSATVLSEERILAHGVLEATALAYEFPALTKNVVTWGACHQHIDVKSNRRIRSDDDVVLNIVTRGTTMFTQGDEMAYALTSRALIKFPG